MLAAGNRAEHRLSSHCETAKDIVTAAIVKEARSGEQILPASRAARHPVTAGRQFIGSPPKVATGKLTHPASQIMQTTQKRFSRLVDLISVQC